MLIDTNMATKQEVTQARTQAQTATQQANDLVAGGYNVENVLKRKLDEAYNYNQDITGQLDAAQADYLSSPATARDKYQNIFNPFQREALVSQYTANQSIPMLSLSNILGTRMGSQADQIRAGTGAYQAQAQRAVSNADSLRQLYSDLQREYEFDQQQNLARQKFALDQQKASQGTGTSLSLLSALLEGEQDPDSIRKNLMTAVITGQMNPSEAKYLQDNLLGKDTGLDAKSASSLMSRLDELGQDIGGVSRGRAFLERIPLVRNLVDAQGSQEVLNAKTSSDFLTMEIARLFESGRLSDQDRNFYAQNMPSLDDIALNPQRAQNKVKAVANYFEQRYPEVLNDRYTIEEIGGE